MVVSFPEMEKLGQESGVGEIGFEGEIKSYIFLNVEFEVSIRHPRRTAK